MKIKIPKSTLLRGIQLVQNIVNPRSSLPILANILIKAQKNQVELTTSDLELAVQTTIAGEILNEGSVTVPAKKFADIISELPNTELTLAVKKNWMVDITAGHCFFKLTGLPEDEFPKLPVFTSAQTLPLESGVFKKMLTMTSFAASYDQARFVLNGVCVLVEGEGIEMVATDGRRMAVIKEKTDKDFKIKKQVIIPNKTAHELIRSLGDEGEVKIGFQENQILFSFDKTNIISRLIEGEFPDFKRVIPGEVKEKVGVDREGFLLAVKRVGLLSTPDSMGIKIELFKNKMVISKSAPNIGEAREELEADYQGPNLEMGFNPSFLLDVLKCLEEEERVFIEMAAPDKPAVFRKGEKYVYLVLPLQVT